MDRNRLSSLGEWLIAVGCVWFVLAFVWLPPAVIFLSFFRLPETFGRKVLPAEFVASTMMMAAGILLRRQRKRQLSPMDYVVVCAGASLLVFGIFRFYGFP